jgi:hypothetical protein
VIKGDIMASLRLSTSFVLAFGFLLSLIPGSVVQAESPLVSRNSKITFTQVDYPGAFSTGVNGINSSGEIVGTYNLSLGGNSHGFTLLNGQFSSFDYPGAVLTEVNGINDAGLVVGTAVLNIPLEKAVGFTYDGQTFTTVSYPGNPYTEGNGINNNGDIVGRTGNLYTHLAAYEFSGGQYTYISPPGQYPSEGAFGINDLGDLVGYVYSSKYKAAFLLENNVFTFFNPGGGYAYGINNGEAIAGTYYTSSFLPAGFVSKDGKRVSVVFPGSNGTSTVTIGNGNQVGGTYYTDVPYENHGYVTSPIILP